MKKVIDGKTYNTETATEIGNYSYLYNGDFHYIDETLYVTGKGTFFLAGEGGAASKYSTDLGNNSSGSGYGMEVLTTGEALQWCEDHDIDADTIAEYFDIEEG